MNSPTTKIQVTLKAAITLDGKIATAGGDSKWITGESARLEGHRLRSQHDAILVGINTVLKDNPSLTTRGIPDGISPTRIILDSKGRLPSDSKVLEDDGVQVIQVIGNEINPATIKSGKNVEILRTPKKIRRRSEGNPTEIHRNPEKPYGNPKKSMGNPFEIHRKFGNP